MDYRIDPLLGRPETDVLAALIQLRTAETQMVRRRAAAQGLGGSDAAALRLVVERLEEDEPVTPTEIASHLGLTTSAVTSLIDRLERSELVVTRKHPTDRRRKIVLPTERAMAVDPLEEEVQGLVEELSSRSRMIIVGFVERVREAVERQAR